MRHSVLPFVVLLPCLAASAQNVQVELSLAGEKTAYKTGEPILLHLTFRSTVGASVNITTTSPASPIDRLVVSPMTGVFPWLADQDRGHPYLPDYAALARIEPDKPQTVELPLNAVYRFDTPGRYSVSVVTRRTQISPSYPPSELTTNTVSFGIQPLSAEEEASRAAALEQKIRQAPNLQAARTYAEELDWLAGDPSTRVKLSLFLHPKQFYPFAVDVTKGLWIARNRAFVVDQLEKALLDPNQDLPSGSTLLTTAIALRARLDAPASQPLQIEQIESAYLKQIVASLPQRKGRSLVTSAQTAFVRLATRKEVTGPEFAAAREVLITHFADVNEFSIDWLLNSFGTYLLDPRLVPALKEILAKQINPKMDQERTAVIKQLARIADGGSRAEVANEVCAGNFSMTDIAPDVPFATLPETDACLLRKMRAATDGPARQSLQWIAALTARFASAALYDDFLALYQQNSDRWDGHTRGSMLAYLVRWNPKQGLPLLEAALPRTASTSSSEIPYALGIAGYIPAIDAFWRERLTGSSPELTAEAAYRISQNGPKEDQEVLRARLDDWRAHWKNHEIPHAEGLLEANLTEAVIRGTNWRLPKDEARSVTSGCLSAACRERFPDR